MNIREVYNYNQPHSKGTFGTTGVAFFNEAFRMSLFKPDLINQHASPVKRYPYHNKGGPAVVGEVYCNITRDDGVKLEMCMSEYGFYYRTNDGGDYGANIYPGGSGTQPSKEYNSDALADVIHRFMLKKITRT